MKTYTTVGDLKKRLEPLPNNYRILLYPKYAKCDGFNKHNFKVDNVCFQEPWGFTFRNNRCKIKEYFGGRKPKWHDLNKHIAIVF